MNRIYQLIFTALFLSSFTLLAQDAAELPSTDPIFAPVAEKKEAEEPSFSLTGYVDAYYQANFIASETAGEAPLVFGSSFTDFANTFGIGNVNLLAEKSIGKVSFVGQVGFGPRAVAANSDSNSDFSGLNYASTIQQLFVTYSPSESVTFSLGNFGTFVGYEVIDAPANMNYSMSYLFSNGPFYHTGLKVDFALAEGLGAMIGVFNDTDSKVDVIGGKHIGAQLSAETGGLAAYLNFLYGVEAEEVIEEEDLTEVQVDLTATLEVSENFMLGLNASSYSTAVDGNAAGGFFGTALYATATLSETTDLSFRGEYFGSTAAEGDTADQPNVIALTASGNFKIGDLRIIPELRFDTGSNGFTFGDNVSDENAFAFLLAGVYSF